MRRAVCGQACSLISSGSWMLGKEYFKAVESLEYAASVHTGIRKDGVTPEFHHQISIGHYTRTLPSLRNQELTLITVLLHDVIEDYNVPSEDILSRFGQDVTNAVLLLSREVNGVRKPQKNYYDDMSGNPIASIVKGADRIHNFQTCSEVFTIDKQEKYIDETEIYIIPMLKKARDNFPDQELAYENIKHALKGQIEFLRLVIKARKELGVKNSVSSI